MVDEAAAIPLTLVKAMLGPYLVFLCSTVNGYEGTGRSLSLKLIQQLRAQGAKVAAGGAKEAVGGAGAGPGAGAASGARTFREIVLHEPIRYAAGDAIETWLNGLLCLDAAEHTPPVPGAPAPPPRLPATCRAPFPPVHVSTFVGNCVSLFTLTSPSPPPPPHPPHSTICLRPPPPCSPAAAPRRV